MADDLDENFELEAKFTLQHESIESDNSMSEPIVPQETKKKRKFEELTDTATPPQTASSKKKKNTKKNITEVLQLNKTELNKPSYIINEFKKILSKYLNDNLSSIEKNELNLNEASLQSDEAVESVDAKLSKLIMPRTSQLAGLPIEKQFNLNFNQTLEDCLKEPAAVYKQSPFILIFCSSAMRCIEIEKKLASSNELIKSKRLRWMHAFAKHKKLNEQVEFLRNSKQPLHLVYATPQRLIQLVAADAIKLEQLRYVVIDYSYRDCKQKRFIDMADIKDEFIKFTFNTLLKLNKNKLKLKFCLT